MAGRADTFDRLAPLTIWQRKGCRRQAKRSCNKSGAECRTRHVRGLSLWRRRKVYPKRRFTRTGESPPVAPRASQQRQFRPQPRNASATPPNAATITTTQGGASQSWTRAIAKPVAVTVRVALGGTEQTSGWSIDTTTGLVTFGSAPGAGVPVTAGFEFDVPIRFDTDTLDVTLDLDRLGSIASIPLLEIRR